MSLGLHFKRLSFLKYFAMLKRHKTSFLIVGDVFQYENYWSLHNSINIIDSMAIDNKTAFMK